jgi:hypothetical protein
MYFDISATYQRFFGVWGTGLIRAQKKSQRVDKSIILGNPEQVFGVLGTKR